MVESNLDNGRDILKSSTGATITNPSGVLNLVIRVVSVTPAVITSLNMRVEGVASITLTYTNVQGKLQVQLMLLDGATGLFHLYVEFV